MAITKIHPIKSTLRLALEYIENPEKTDDTMLVSGYNVDPLNASAEFEATAAMARMMNGNYSANHKSNVLAHHMIQSFAPYDKITPEEAHELGKKWADEILGGHYEYVISTHVDKGHIHNHVIFNATSFYDYKKFESKKNVVPARLREVSDRLCEEKGLHVIKNANGKGTGHYEWQQRKSGMSWKAQIEKHIEEAVNNSSNYEQFKELMTGYGVEVVDTGVHIKFRLLNSGQEKFTRGKTIGDNCTREAIINRISSTNNSISIPEHEAFAVKVELMSRTAMLSRINDLAETLRVINKEQITNPDDFDSKIRGLRERIISANANIKMLDETNRKDKEILKYQLIVRKYSPYAGELSSRSVLTRSSYEKRYESELRSYDHAVAQLERLGVNHETDPDKFMGLVARTDERRAGLSSDVQKLESRVSSLRKAMDLVNSIINSNGDSSDRHRGGNEYGE